MEAQKKNWLFMKRGLARILFLVRSYVGCAEYAEKQGVFVRSGESERLHDAR